MADDPIHEQVGAGYDPGAVGYEMQGRARKPNPTPEPGPVYQRDCANPATPTLIDRHDGKGSVPMEAKAGSVIERAARALCRVQDQMTEKPRGWTDDQWDDELALSKQVEDDTWQHYVPEVRAVLAAIRDIDLQTEDDTEIAMLVAGRAQLPEHDEPLLEDALNCWQAMIDAALEEG